MDSYLIQRLQRPYTSDNLLEKLGESLAFGGGLKNGGLSDGAFGLLRKVFSFDYMGSAEFEFGALPKALKAIAADVDKLTVNTIEVETKNGNVGMVFVIAREEQMDEVCDYISSKGYDEYDREFMTKESVRLQANIDGDKYSDRTVGWFELDNGYFFFTDKTMFQDVCQIFGIKE